LFCHFFTDPKFSSTYYFNESQFSSNYKFIVIIIQEIFRKYSKNAAIKDRQENEERRNRKILIEIVLKIKKNWWLKKQGWDAGAFSIDCHYSDQLLGPFSQIDG
jgi:hypothetical protein